MNRMIPSCHSGSTTSGASSFDPQSLTRCMDFGAALVELRAGQRVERSRYVGGVVPAG